MALPTLAFQNRLAVQQFANALYDVQVGTVTMQNVFSDIAALGSTNAVFNGYYSFSFGSMAAQDVAASVAANLGLVAGQNGLTAADADAAEAVIANAINSAPGAEGAAIASLLDLYAGLVSDATFGAAATAWNAQVNAAMAYTGADDILVGTGEPTTTFMLTAGADRGADFVGTDGDDMFMAPLDVNQLGQTINSLQSVDVLNGGAGRDQLWADLIKESAAFVGGVPRAIEPTTSNIEELYFNARETVNLGELGVLGFEAQVVTVNARKMIDVDYIESYYSDVDLTVRGLTTNTSSGPNTLLGDMTVSMDHTSGVTNNTDEIYGPPSVMPNGSGSGDYGDDFYEYYINGQFGPASMKVLFEQNYLVPGQASEFTLELRIVNAFQLAENDLPLVGFLGVTFTAGAQVVTVDISTAVTYAQVVTLINAELVSLGLDVTAVALPLRNAVFTDDIGPYLQGEEAGQYTPVQLVSNTLPLAAGPIELDSNVQDFDGLNTWTNPTSSTSLEPLTINIELEKVGRGEDGGGLIVGGDNYTKGFDIFNVTVKGDEDMPSSLAYLLTTPHDGLETLNITSEVRTDNSYADLQIGNVNTPVYSIIDVNTINATTFMADLDINQAFIVSSGTYDYNFGGGNDNLVLSIEAFASNAAAGVKFDVNMGGGNNTVDIDLDGDAVDTVGDYFRINTGSGNDTIVVTTYDDPSHRTMYLLDNLDINSGAGNDKITVDGKGLFNIDAGSGNDLVYITNGGANSAVAGNSEVFGRPTGPQPWADGTTVVADQVLYNATMTVSFAGFESTVNVATTAANNYIATQLDINAAIAKAINDSPVLKELLRVTSQDGEQQITVSSVHDGQNQLYIELNQPALTLTNIVAANLTALKQGIINTSAATSTDLITTQNTVDYFNGTYEGDGWLNQVGDDFVAGDVANRFFPVDLLGINAAASYLSANYSEINMGSGANDIVVLSSSAYSANTLIFDNQFADASNKVTVLNFFNVFTADTNQGPGYNNTATVGSHALDFTYYLDNTVDPSPAAGNTQSVVPLAVTLNLDAVAEANSVSILNFDGTVALSVTWANLNATNLLQALNGVVAAPVVGGIVDATLSAVDTTATLVGTVQDHIVMVQNLANFGEFKIFHLTSSAVDAAANNGDFTTATQLGTIDFGYGFTAAGPVTGGDAFFSSDNFTEVNLIGSVSADAATVAMLATVTV